jgi:hypothetical protein
MVTSSILTIEVYWCFQITVFIPSEEYSISKEWESSEFTLCIDLNWYFSLISWASDVFSLCCNGYNCTIEEDEVFILIASEVLIFIDLEE